MLHTNRSIKAWGRHDSPRRVSINVALTPDQFNRIASEAIENKEPFSARMRDIVAKYYKYIDK